MAIKITAIEIYLPNSQSLKNKRSVIKSIIHKIQRKYNVSIAEIDYNDKWKSSKLCIAMVSNENLFLAKKFTEVIKFIEESYSDIEISKIEDIQ